MLTVKEINNMKFEQAKIGYKTDEVDDFLRTVALDVTRYLKEKDESEEKIRVLVESVKEYKKDEDALKDALLDARKQGRAVIAEAHEVAEKILADARNQAEEIIGGTRIQLEKEKKTLAKMQKEVAGFKANLLAMYKEHLAVITSMPDDYDDDEEEPLTVSREEPVENEIEDMQPVFEDSSSEYYGTDDPAGAEKSSFPFSEPVHAKKSGSKFSDFSNLEFGQNK